MKGLLMVIIFFFNDTLGRIIFTRFYLNSPRFKERLNRALDLADRGQQVKSPVSISGVQSEAQPDSVLEPPGESEIIVKSSGVNLLGSNFQDGIQGRSVAWAAIERVSVSSFPHAASLTIGQRIKIIALFIPPKKAISGHKRSSTNTKVHRNICRRKRVFFAP